MRTILNGEPRDFDIQPDETALEVIRERAGLTGTKLVCGTGVCGACTVLLNGTPVCSCLLPATALEGHTVQTIEGVATDGALHPVQKAFMACDALQCGFCTPGFIVEGVAFYERWRRERGRREPSREQIADALEGHLCRCAAYVGICNAIRGACAGTYDTGQVTPPRVEALDKVTGRARYTTDVRLQGQLEGKILRSPHAHATVVSIDASAAQAMPGVKAIMELLKPDRTVRYVGDAVVALAAVDRRTAEEAVGKIQVQYDVHPAVIGMEAARKAGSPLVYPRLGRKAPSNAEGMLAPAMWRGNVRQVVVNIGSGKPRKARRLLREARATSDPKLVEGVWRAEAQLHTAFEPHVAVAQWNGDRLVVYLSSQAVHKAGRELAKHLRLRPENVTVLSEHVGGAFGAKTGVTEEAIAAAHLSRQSGAPVRVMFDRLEEMTVTGYRPGVEIQLALLADDEHKPAAAVAHCYSDGGVSVGSAIAPFFGLTYQVRAKDVRDYDVVSHGPIAKPFRGPGGAPACWALEQAVDEMAHRLNEDPIALRRKWDGHPLRRTLYDWAEALPMWRGRTAAGSEHGRFRRGVGVAIGHWLYFFHAETHVEVRAGADGITATTASQDMGNGTRSVMARAVGSVFGLPPTSIAVRVGDSHAPRGPMSAGSRTTASVYPAARKAAEEVRDKLWDAARTRFNLKDAAPAEGGIRHAGGQLAWGEIFNALPPVSATARRGRDAGLPAMPLAFGQDSVRTGRQFTGAVHMTEVEVDTRLGRIRPLRVWGGLTAGKIVAPELARSQCYGGVIQGLGYALYEERQTDRPTGTIISVGLEDYRIPGIGDIPEIEIAFLEEGFEHAQGAAVGLSELSTLAVAASVGNAVFNATGVRQYHLPIRPDRLLESRRT